MKTSETISQLINCLTSNEDLRQDLWVHYLSGNSVESFASYLEKLSVEYAQEERLKQLFDSPPSGRFFKLLETFSEFERSMVWLLMLGFSIGDISQYKGISQVRVRQTLQAIRYNKSWEVYHGTKDESH